MTLDTLSIVPGSVLVWHQDTLVSFAFWKIQSHDAKLIFSEIFKGEIVTVQYRVMGFIWQPEYRHKPTTIISPKKDTPYKPYLIGGSNNSFTREDGIRKSGSISRGVLVGNNQNLAVNSTLNLQLAGKITEKYELLASISDDNIPIQADGNTSQLQDFDQVFIQISDLNTKLIAGDFILSKPTGYYMQYNKRAQGLYFNKQWKAPDHSFQVESSASVSKGRFGRQVIQGIEGNQGPYRLLGADGEPFIIVLSGTEQIYIDGKLLQRGLDKDYIIDYNSAEITFTPRHLITKDRRITVEFQYSEKRYARPLLQSALQWQNETQKFYLQVFSESDAKNQPLQQELSDSDKQQLALAGDDPLAAVTSGIQETAFTNSQVLYAQIDSLGFSQVLIYSNDSILARYRAIFNKVGLGNGDYIEDGFTATGKKYKWVVPIVNGTELTHQGDFAPVALLVSPKKSQLITAGHELKKEKSKLNSTHRHHIKTEGAFSNKDINTFSSIDNSDNLGWAAKSSYQFQHIKNDTSAKQKNQRTFKTNLSYEFNHHHFNAIERFREVEFNRNWNFGGLQPKGAMHLAQAEIGWGIDTKGQFTAGAQWLQLQSWGKGVKSHLNANWRTPNGFNLQVIGSLLDTDGQVRSNFLRHKSDISQTWKILRMYYRDEHEKNTIYTAQVDTLSNLSYQFYDWEMGVGTADTAKKSITVYYRNRFENRLDQGRLGRASIADQYGVVARWNARPESRLALFISNRRLRINNIEAISTAPENTLVTRIEYNAKLKSGFIQSSTFYETGSGLEQRKEYVYLEVQPGQGNFVWVDYNANGIKELNEFEAALYAYEANYIRTAIQSNTYARTFTNQLNQSFTIQLERIIKQQKGWRKYLARLSAQSTIRIERKNNSRDPNDRFNTLQYTDSDTSLLSLNGLVRHVLFVNKANPIVNAEFTYQRSNGKNLLSNGFETRGDEFIQSSLRWTIQRTWTISTDVKSGTKRAASDFLNGRNYSLDYLLIQPILSWQPGNIGRLNVKSQYTDKINTAGVERAVIRKLGIEGVWSDVKKGSVQCEVNYFKIAFNSSQNNSLTFDMLEGLSPGNNLTWGLTVQRTIAKNLQLSINYNGRKPETVSTIHAGGMQLRAFF